MSGRKTTYTTIPESELRDLRTRAQRAASLQASNRLLNELTAQRQRVEALNSQIASLNRALGEQRSAASKEAEALRGQLRAAVDEMNLRNQQEASRAQWELEQLRARLTGDLRRTREEIDRSVAENRAYTDRGEQPRDCRGHAPQRGGAARGNAGNGRADRRRAQRHPLPYGRCGGERAVCRAKPRRSA